MSKRTFNELIDQFAGAATIYAQTNDDDPLRASRAEGFVAAGDALRRALRKSGIPLDAPAPQ